jgi:bacterioferritin-associated ferredoxin
MYVCLCKGLTETDVQRVVRDGQIGPERAISALRLDDDDCCGRCARNIHELINVTCGSAACG